MKLLREIYELIEEKKKKKSKTRKKGWHRKTYFGSVYYSYGRGGIVGNCCGDADSDGGGDG